MELPKDKPFRSKKYLAWIRNQSCVVTGRTENIVAHHITNTGRRGMGTKTDDSNCIPLEAMTHQMLHANPKKWEGEFGEQKEYLKIIKARAIKEGVL